MKRRVHIRQLVDNALIRRENRAGRDIMLVPSATLPDNIVMKGIMYPAEEIEASFQALEGTPAPLGHPISEDGYISALSPEAINKHWIGAWNTNVRRVNGRVHVDKAIDTEVASRTEDGQRVLNAIAEGEPIHTSIAVLINMEPAPEGAAYESIARNIVFDHDAILLDEPGAATPEDGVGMMVNSAGETEEVHVDHVDLDDIGVAADILLDSMERKDRDKKRMGLRERIMSVLAGLSGSETVVANHEETAMDEEVKQAIEGLEAKLDAKLDSVLNSLQPIQEHVKVLEANQQAQQESERKDAIAALVKTGLYTEDDQVLKELSVNSLKDLARRMEPQKAAAATGRFEVNETEDPFADVDLNAAIDKKEVRHAG